MLRILNVLHYRVILLFLRAAADMARTNIKLFCGNSNPALALDVAKMLDVELSDVTVSGGFWRRVIFVCYHYLFQSSTAMNDHSVTHAVPSQRVLHTIPVHAHTVTSEQSIQVCQQCSGEEGGR